MGFYYKNKEQAELVIDAIDSYKDGIEIVNNEEISFNLKDFKDIEHSDSIHKIEVDFGDGSNFTLNKPIKSEDENWMNVSHRFAFKEDINNGIIKIHFYNLYGESIAKEINFKLKQLSLQEQEIEFRLVSANLRNDKKISYVFNNINKNQLILAKNR